MNKCSFLFLLFGFLAVTLVSAQETSTIEQKTDKGIDSLKTDLGKKGVVIQNATVERKAINPLGPSKAAFYSAVLPGLGQIYNKRYWKAPIVWAAIGIGGAAFIQNNNNFNIFRDAFKRRRAGFTDDQFFARNDGVIDVNNPRVSNAALQDAQERFQRDRDLALLVTIGLYALNIIDANVDAHLKQYNVNEQLSMDIKPTLDFNPITNRPNLGLAMVYKF